MTLRLLFSESSMNLGGQELQILQQMQALQQRGIATRLLCRPDSRIATLAVERNLSITPVAFRNSLHPRSILATVRIMNHWRPAAVISHSGHDANTCALAASLIRPRPRLIRVRTYQPGLPHAWTYNHLADLTLVPSADLRRKLLNNPRIDPQRIHVMYPGLALEQLDETATVPLPPQLTAWLATRPGPLLVHAAMLRHEKGHAVLLDAMARLVASYPTLRCILAGEGDLYDSLAQSIRDKCLTEHVLLAGLISPIAALYQRADLLVMPSLIEPLGMSQSEALYLGVPVIASRTGGIPETVQDHRTGLLVTPGDVNAWVDAITWALDHPQAMLDMAQEGRAFVRHHFSISTNIDQLLGHVTHHAPAN